MRFYRWMGFVMAIWVMAISGSNYTLSNYSSALKAALGINQMQLDSLSLAKDLGKALGIVAGLASERVPAWVVLLIGAALGFLGFGAQWLIVSGLVQSLPFWMVFIALGLSGNSVAWFNTAVLLVCVRNFPRNRGPVAGLLKGYLGLSAAIFSSLCDFFLSGTPSHFLLILTLLPSVVCVTASPFLRLVPPSETLEEEAKERRNVQWFNVFATGLALYIALVEVFPPNTTRLKRVFAYILLLLLVAPAVVPALGIIDFTPWVRKARVKLASGLKKAFITKQAHDVENHPEGALAEANEPLLNASNIVSLQESSERHENSQTYAKDGDLTSRDSHTSVGCWEAVMGQRGACGLPVPQLGEDHRCSEMLRSVDFWLFYWSSLCSGGAGLAFSNNLGQIGVSLGFDSISHFTALFSIGGFAGRVLSGLVSEYFVRKAGLPRSVWMAATKLPITAMLLCLSTGSQQSLIVGTVVIGFCYGFQMALMIPMVSEFYGLKHFGTNYNISMTVLLFGSLLFSDLLAGCLYDRAATITVVQQGSYTSSSHMGHMQGTLGRFPFSGDDSIPTCYGSACFGLTFVILSGVLLLSSVLDVVLVVVTRPLYKKMQAINGRSCQ